jgi:hypothetical membrane protein
LCRVSALAGIAAPILFTLLVVVESLLRPGYSQLADVISDLGVGPYSMIQNLNFIATGLLIGLFAFSIKTNLPAKSGTKKSDAARSIVIATVGTIIAGLTLVLWAWFPDDYFFFWIHTGASFIAFFSLSAAQIFAWRALRRNPSWGWYSKFSLIVGVLTLIAIFVFTLTLGTWTSFQGLAERFVVAVPFIWLAATGTKLYSRKVFVD